MRWWAGRLSLALGVMVGGSEVGAQQLPANAVAVPDAEAALSSVQARLDELSRLAGQVPSWLNELAALVERNRRSVARIEEAARAKEVALSGRIGSLQDQLSQRDAELAEAAAALAKSEARLERQAQTAAAERARLEQQLAAATEQLRQRERELEKLASLRSENADLRQQLDAARTELERKSAENDLLAEQLVALRMAAAFATVVAQDTLAAIEDQVEVLQAVANVPPAQDPGYLASDRSASPAAPLAAAWVEDRPPMPYPKPFLPQGQVAVWVPVSDAVEGGSPNSPGALPAIDDGFAPADMLDAAVSRWAPAAGGDRVAPDSRGDLDIMAAAAPLSEPLMSAGLEPSDHDAIDSPFDAWEQADRGHVQEIAERLADGLRATRAEAVFRGQERVFTVDVAERTFAAGAAEEVVLLDPALEIQLLTARSELVGEGKGRIRFFPDGSSTGGRIDLELLGERAAVKVRWSSGLVSVER